MKLLLTEKFLWDIFKLIKIKDGVMNEIWSKQYYGLKHPFAMLWPDYFEYKDNYWERHKDRKRRKKFIKVISYLKNKGYLNIKDIKNRKAVIITPKGMDEVFKTKIKLAEKKKRRDEKWQMILFDIPEQKRKERDLFRKQLKYLGYKKLQRSVWVCPYDVLVDSNILIARYNLKRFVRLLLVEEVKI
jgi:hypothetical protein